MCRKVYKSVDELAKILESRGVALDIDPIPLIRREGYYALINGYKGPFLDKIAMQSSPEDRYLPGTNFSDIYELYQFDRELREALFPYITHAESAIRSIVIDAFCLKHPDVDAYLDRNNYVEENWMLFPKRYKGDKHKAYANGINSLMNMFKRKTTPSDRAPDYVLHYLSRYGAIPLWVLQNNLTFGNVKHFYQLLERDVQAQSCRSIQVLSVNQVRLEPHMLLKDIEVLVDYRNICAHNDRFYCARPRGRTFGDMFHSLWRILPEDDVRSFLNQANNILHAHPTLLKNQLILDISKTMGAILIPY